jgi:hypothetical protein
MSNRSGAGTGDDTGETELRGEELTGSERKRAADHVTKQKQSNPDATIRLDDETDTLYEDGLDVEDNTPAMGTDGRSQDNAR